ncbi:hypothetical protein O181_048723 [Austropuccinia psidii MF-1]|uniref:Uncharacterized protein n=1 Tax=Austropuccinia psidii MF-1 TaxID=1389203 RepID=A0A9Q3DYI4_9BASI|nr:hypothetical protein [Austropuccinia psidii MF-1]
MRNHKLLTKLPGDLEHAVKCICSKEPTLDEMSTTLQEVMIRTSIGFHNCESPNYYADNSPKDREEIFSREQETRKDQEGHEPDSDSVGNGCGNNPYSEPNPHEEHLVEFMNHGREEIGPVHSKRRKPMTKHPDGLKHKPPDSEVMTTRELLAQGHMSHTDTSKKTGQSHQSWAFSRGRVCQPVTESQSTSMTARYHQNMELGQISSKGIKRKRKLTSFKIYKSYHHRTNNNKVIPAQSYC